MTEWIAPITVGVVNLLALAVGWGDLRRQVISEREKGDERHQDNAEHLVRIEEKLDRVNGSVGQHEVRLDNLEDRL